MITNYYPWNVQTLATWLRLELRTYRSPRALAVTLQVPSSSLRAWLSSPLPTITLSDLRSIAEYRRWSLQQTMGWLELKPAHMEELIAQDSLGDRLNWGEAKAIWFGKPAR
jgi:hypothetical protein